ncbi:n(6)-adenine-specific methyltransferase METTL4 [Caerostris darwini]|uniref:N(6)-adenine-specific methyltransferase METTL4 n=1 Tax=Caerostris darwini TaxID=1538125 RepID=A0AAV4S6A7_9ARAC|nr:n(6)-adenine-specific methyltransferase METTL4 [Caerostris darwini]
MKQSKKSTKKNKNLPANENSEENAVIHIKITCLLKAARDLNFLKSPDITAEEWFENNYKAQKAAKEALNLPNDISTIPEYYYNNNSSSTVLNCGTEKYVLPAESRFHLCDISNVVTLKDKKYDLIVLDPPWENKSVRRKKRYGTLCCESLTDLPIEDLCIPGCLIVMWVTNNTNQLNFIKEKVFPKWKIFNPVMWHWMKITQGGHLIHPIEWHHKKPYENLLLGYVSSSTKDVDSLSEKKIESNKVIVSVPSSIHSHKPPLVEVLKPYIPQNPQCLELFARYLLPGWTSLGNEVLKLQNIKLFEKIR